MLEEYTFKSIKQIRAYGDSLRLRLIHLLIERPMTGSQLARKLDLPRQKVHYHLNVLKDAGLIVVYDEGYVKGLREVYYQPIARSFYTPEESSLGEMYREFVETAQELVPRSYLIQVETDLQSHKTRREKELIFCVQEGAALTAEQLQEICSELKRINKKVRDYGVKNLQHGLHPLQPIRLTIFQVPIQSLE